MKTRALLTAILVVTIHAATRVAQQPAPSGPPTTASAEVMACADAQMVVDRLLQSATLRMEMARQTNSAADMRAAIDALQNTLRDARAQLAPCGKLEPAGAHAGHTMAPAEPSTSPAKPAPTSKPARTVKPPASDPHAGHAMPSLKPVPAKPPAKPTPKAPPASDPHAGHAAPPASQPPAPAKAAEGQAVDPVCGLKVDPKTAPNARHQGQTFYFCSDQHRQSFLKDPAKYLPKK